MDKKTRKTDKPTATAKLEQLLHLMGALRNPETGCPWYLAQDFHSIAPYAIEEAHEVADACARQSRADLCEELGDLLLQIVLHARIAEEEGSFCFADIADAIIAKLIRRHPHIFGDKAERAVRATADEIKRQWVLIKAQDQEKKNTVNNRGKHVYLDSVSSNLPAIMEAAKLQNEAEKIGFDWAEPLPVLKKLTEEIAELEEALAAGNKAEIKEEYGDVLFTAVNLGRKLETDFEMSLRAANLKFRRRFNFIEQALQKQNKTLNEAELNEMEALWQKAKHTEK